ncbi:hypothetical protein KTE96_25790 [Burkholderia multivorans]|uniref:hypothetical protein n=1 Tax=Burkholderia multivorans TaxID=87883 RepID=UPI001C228687|nr:hypothetical protein [Burkholderia multivorans]MBU9615150.1 hypothetical protein [Burkholderia multivorans]
MRNDIGRAPGNRRDRHNDKTWGADLGGKTLGGKLVVQVTAGTEQFRPTAFIAGTNPSEDAVLEFLKTQKDAVGFDRMINQESRFKNFINADNEPVVAFDNEYGMTHVTNPAPTYGTIMCDPDTSNIGWDMSKDANKDKSVEELHKRDKDTYKSGKSGRSDEHAWIYSGICYADHMANN